MQQSNFNPRLPSPQESILSIAPANIPMSINQNQKLTLEKELYRPSDSKHAPDLYECSIPEAPADTSISVDPQNQHPKYLLLEEERSRASGSKNIPYLYESNPPKDPDDISISVDQKKQQRKEFPREETYDTTTGDQKHQDKEGACPANCTSDPGIQDINLPTSSVDKHMTVDQNQREVERERRKLPQPSSYQLVNAHLFYPKHNLKSNWIFILLLLLITALLGSVRADTDCKKMNDWLPAMFNATGTECCFQAGVTCVSDRITEMYIYTLIIRLVIFTTNNSQARSPLH
jgi:hypothetical protein